MKKPAAFLAMLICAAAFAQGPPKIAVYVTGDLGAGEKRGVEAGMLGALVRGAQFTALERFMAEAEKEGAMDDSRICQLGWWLGARYVCIADIAAAPGLHTVSARILDVETAKALWAGKADGSLNSAQAIEAVSNNIVRSMAPVSAPAPAVQTPPPVVQTSPPVVQTPPPVVQTPPPVVQTPAPAVQTPPPAVQTPPPVVQTPPPVVQTPAPIVQTSPPVIQTPAPAAQASQTAGAKGGKPEPADFELLAKNALLADAGPLLMALVHTTGYSGRSSFGIGFQYERMLSVNFSAAGRYDYFYINGKLEKMSTSSFEAHVRYYPSGRAFFIDAMAGYGSLAYENNLNNGAVAVGYLKLGPSLGWRMRFGEDGGFVWETSVGQHFSNYSPGHYYNRWFLMSGPRLVTAFGTGF